MLMKMWGYKSDGSAQQFELSYGEKLPEGWSSDISVIEDPALRSGEAISLAGGESTRSPVRLSFYKEEIVPEEDPEPLQYDENNKQILPVKRGPGRPPKASNAL